MLSNRVFGILIACVGTLGVTPDAALLRAMALYGGTTMVITVWRFIISGVFNVATAVMLQGGVGKLLQGLYSAPIPLVVGASIICVTNIGFVVSLLWVDPAKALLLISLNPLWAALLGRFFLGDRLELRTCVAQGCSLLSIALVFVPNVLAVFDSNSDTAPEESSGSPADEDEPAVDLLDLVPLATGLSIAAFMTFSRSCSRRGIPDAALEAAPSAASFVTAVVAIGVAKQQGDVALFDGLAPQFWLALAINGFCLAGYNAALVIAPRYLPSVEVALILLGETIFGPVWVYFCFGVVPSIWTLAGGGMLLLTLVAHEVSGAMQGNDDACSNASSFELPLGTGRSPILPTLSSSRNSIDTMVSAPDTVYYEHVERAQV